MLWFFINIFWHLYMTYKVYIYIYIYFTHIYIYIYNIILHICYIVYNICILYIIYFLHVYKNSIHTQQYNDYYNHQALSLEVPAKRKILLKVLKIKKWLDEKTKYKIVQHVDECKRMVWGRKYLGKLGMSDVGQRGGYLKTGGGAVTPYKLRTFPSYCRRREGGGGEGE